MEIDITDFYNNAETRLYSNSIAASGLKNIAEITWNNAQKANYSFISNKTRLPFLKYMKEMGMEDTLKLNVNKANALFIQLISGDIEERKELFETWEEYYKSDQVSGSLFESEGKIYYLLDISGA